MSLAPKTVGISMRQRHLAPVFVLGSPRSGTTLLYDMLLSAGGFAVYLAESNVFNLLAPRFGDLGSRANRKRLLQAWLPSKLFVCSGLNTEYVERRILEDCQNAGDFLRIIMGEICRMQGKQRWAENSPEAMLYLPLIKQLIPDALVVHIIRDGRDVASSLGKLRYIRPFPWEDRHSLTGCGLYWEWMVQQGRKFGQSAGADYIEVHFEDLLARPQEVLDQIGGFIDQPLDYKTIQRFAYGTVSKPNSSFARRVSSVGFNPVGRWKQSFSSAELKRFERILGNTLQEFGYSPVTDGLALGESLATRSVRLLHRTYFVAKLWGKNNSIFRAIRPAITSAELDEIVHADTHSPLPVQTSVSAPYRQSAT
jgi:sulfotransferase family protein